MPESQNVPRLYEEQSRVYIYFAKYVCLQDSLQFRHLSPVRCSSYAVSLQWPLPHLSWRYCDLAQLSTVILSTLMVGECCRHLDQYYIVDRGRYQVVKALGPFQDCTSNQVDYFRLIKVSSMP